MKKVFKKIIQWGTFIVNGFFNKTVNEDFNKEGENFNLIEQWLMSRNMFMHYAIRSMYDYGDNYRHIVSEEEREYCRDMANYWDKQVKNIREKIYNKNLSKDINLKKQ